MEKIEFPIKLKTMTDLYSIKICKIIYRNKHIILYIQVIPLGASDGNYFPTRLKDFFLMTLCNINKFDLELSTGKMSDHMVKNIDINVNKIRIFHNLDVDDLYDNLDNKKYFDKKSKKFIKKVNIYKSSYLELIKLLKNNVFIVKKYLNIKIIFLLKN